MDNYDRDDEEKAERLDRNWNELLQELRVSQTGVQILTGFLLTMPLQPKFADLGGFTRNAYTAAMTAVAALIFGIVFGDGAGQLAGGISLAMFLVAWVGLPLVISGRSRG